MPYYIVNKFNKAIGETGTTNRDKAQQYGEMADAYIDGDLVNVFNLDLPATLTDFTNAEEFKKFRNIATQLAISYFYKFESGDDLTTEQAEKTWARWFIGKWRRPRFKARGGETAF